MFENIKKYETTFSDLKEVELPYNYPFLLSVTWENVNFEFLINLRKDSNNLFVFGNGAYDSEKFSPPVFQRHSWIEDIQESVIMYNDPTLYLGKMNIGWGQGTTNRFYLKDLAEIFEILINKLRYEKDRVYFYGSSAGGFMSLYLAGLIKGTIAIVNNPQTIVYKFYQSHVQNMFKFSYPNLKSEEIQEQFKERLDIICFYKKIRYVPNIYYLQNLACSFDVINHLTPFISGLSDLNKYLNTAKVRFEFYSNEEQGHNPIDKNSTLRYLEVFSKFSI